MELVVVFRVCFVVSGLFWIMRSVTTGRDRLLCMKEFMKVVKCRQARVLLY